MWKDPIVEEVRRVRAAHAAKFNYDIDRIVNDVKARERQGGREVISAPERQTSRKDKKPPFEAAKH